MLPRSEGFWFCMGHLLSWGGVWVAWVILTAYQYDFAVLGVLLVGLAFCGSWLLPPMLVSRYGSRN